MEQVLSHPRLRRSLAALVLASLVVAGGTVTPPSQDRHSPVAECHQNPRCGNESTEGPAP